MGFKLQKFSKIIGLGGKHKSKDTETKQQDSSTGKIVQESQSPRLENKKGQIQNENIDTAIQERQPSPVEEAQTAPVEQNRAEVRVSSVPEERLHSGSSSIHGSHFVTGSFPLCEQENAKGDNLEAQEVHFRVINTPTESSDEINISLDHSDEIESAAHSSKPASDPGTSEPRSVSSMKQKSDKSETLKRISCETVSKPIRPHAGEHVPKCSSSFSESKSVSLDKDKDQHSTNTCKDAKRSRSRQQTNRIETTPVFRKKSVDRKHVAVKEVYHPSCVKKVNYEGSDVQVSSRHEIVRSSVAVSPSVVPCGDSAASNGRARPPSNSKAHAFRINQISSYGVEKKRSPSMSSDRRSVISGLTSSHLSGPRSPRYLLPNRKRDPLLHGRCAPRNVVNQDKDGIAPDVLEVISKCSQKGRSSQPLKRGLPLRVSPHQRNGCLQYAGLHAKLMTNVVQDLSLTQGSSDHSTPKRYSGEREMRHSGHNHVNPVDAECEPLWSSNSSTLSLSSPPHGVERPHRTPLRKERSSRSSHQSVEQRRENYERGMSLPQRNSYRNALPNHHLASHISPCRCGFQRGHVADDHRDLRGYRESRSTGNCLPRHSPRPGEIETDNDSFSGYAHHSTSLSSPLRRDTSGLRPARNVMLGRQYLKTSPTHMLSRRTSPKAAPSTHLSSQREASASEEEYILDEVQYKLDLLAEEIANRDYKIEQEMRSSPWKRLYHHSNRQEREERRALVAQFKKLAKIRGKIENGTIHEEIKARKDRIRKQEEVLNDPNGVYLRLYNARHSARTTEGSPNTSRGSYYGSTSGSAHGRVQRKQGGSDGRRGRGNASTFASPSVSGRSGDHSHGAVRRTEAQREAFFSNMYTRAMTEVREKEKKVQTARKEKEQHDLDELVISRLTARVERDLLHGRHYRNKDPLAVAQSKWKKQASKEDSAVQTFVNQLIHGPKLSLSEQKRMASRLTVQGYIKPETLQKKQEEQEMKGCTFHPCIGDYAGLNNSARRSAVSPNAGNRKGSDSGLSRTDGSEYRGKSTGKRSDGRIAENCCNNLYKKALQGREREEERRKEYERQQRLNILKSRLSSDHHFRRRVELNPSLAEHFMSSLSV
ncbi:unnamed protein product [Phytomonas sp. EM1]|nr:unnamed protein product [Phytomonas sp. EM1]|eukprot:CCW60018.1 unnamed protein product [Phytomonas sp. isolate EM1]